MGAWLKTALSPLVDTLLSPGVIDRRGLFRYSAVERLITDHRSSREDHTDHLQALVNLEIFSRIYLDGSSPEDVADELKEYCRT